MIAEMAAIRLEKSSGNVFRDLGFSPGESESLRIRAELMVRLSKILERQGLTQAAAAKRLGVTQPRISDLVRGRIERFSVDTLIDMVFRAGGTVRVTVREHRRAA